MDILLVVLNLIVLVAVGLGFGYLKGLPQRLHEEGLRRYEHGLNEQLERLRADLHDQLEERRIAREELQVQMREQFLRLAEFGARAMVEPEKFEKVLKDKKAAQAFKKELLEIGGSLFFFASDDTIRAYMRWRKAGQDASTAQDGKDILVKYGELMLSARRDLGYKETGLEAEDFLRVIVTDWDKFAGSGSAWGAAGA